MSFNFSMTEQNYDLQARALFLEGEAYLDEQKFEDALKSYQKSLSIQEHEDTHYKIGIVLELMHKTDAALKSYRKCIAINAYHIGALENAGDIYRASTQGLLAIECYGMAVMAHPDVLALKEKLIGVLSFQTFKAMSEPLRNLILECMKDDRIDLSYLALGWLSICETMPAFQSIYKCARFLTYDDFKRNFSALSQYKALNDPFFITGLGRVFAPDFKFERFLTHIRRYCLENRDFWVDNDDLSRFVSTLGLYTFLTEYVFELSEGEEKTIQALTDKCRTQKLDRAEIMLLACYSPLSHIEGIQNSVEPFADDLLIAPLLKRHIELENTLRILRDEVESLTPIKDDVSRKVQEQYEESPYPRWSGFQKTAKPAEAGLWGKNAQILIAGCGTGLEAIELAYCFPDANVLAVDLSRSSIAYGMMKAKEYGITNLTFKHGDILELGVLNKKFDLVTSSGVLHHMKDPMAGWAIITDLLKPDGLMRIALYSQYSRQSINAARHIISDKKIEPTLRNIRDFRTHAREMLSRQDYDGILSMRDYYTTSECRDLLFHVQEQQFTAPQIAQCLDQLGLEFQQFFLIEKTLARYRTRFKDDPKAINLNNWDQFEKTYPGTFIGMYKFWCRKKRGS